VSRGDQWRGTLFFGYSILVGSRLTGLSVASLFVASTAWPTCGSFYVHISGHSFC
jgi:hypothetical protein